MRRSALQRGSAGRLTLTLTPTWTLTLALTCVAPTIAQDAGGLHFVAAINDYYRVEYVPPPVLPALDVIFAGEPVQLRLEVGNRNSIAETLTTAGRQIGEAFSVGIIRAPNGASTPTLIPETAGRITARSEIGVAWGEDIMIPSRGSVTFKGAITTSPSTVPGVYELRITPNLQTSSKVYPLGTIVRYEVRAASTFADHIEMMRRQMTREFHHANPAGAEAAADALLEKYPRSAAAYEVKGRLASSKGNRKEAIEALGKARELLSSGEDELWRAQTANNLLHALNELTQHIDAIATNAPLRVH